MSEADDRRIDAVLDVASTRLAPHSDSARLDAELMLSRTIDTARSYLFAHPEDVLDERTFARFEALLQRRLDGEPMAYILGYKEFWSLELLVSPATLVPRPETELVVELALREIPRRAEWRVLDLGTGSGAIAIALASERRLCQVTASDISYDALAVARENARQHALANITFVQGSWIEPLAGQQFDLVVSNPPYVEAGDPALAALRHEPVTALSSGKDGLDAIRALAALTGQILGTHGMLLIEHGAAQKDSVAAILAAAGWTDVVNHTDHSGRPRVTAARRDGK